jgi:Bardet-Biedl syndrome 7 protein
LSAITIVKDQLSLDASNRKLSLDIKSDLNEESVFHMLSILQPIISKQLDVAKKWMLIDAIKELATGEDTSFLSSEYREVLKDEAMIRQRYNE